jgi:hypothetical protein
LLVAIPPDNTEGVQEAMGSAPFPAVRIGVMRDDGSIRLH